MTKYHKHHIVPRHMGGSDDPSNLILLTVEEHAEAHRLLWEQNGREQDYYAWKGLLGLLSKKDIINGLTSFPGEKNPFYGKKHTQESKKKMSEMKKGKYKGDKNPMFGKKRPDLSERNRKGHSLEARKKMSEKRQGRIWVKKEDNQTLIYEKDLQQYLALGWIRGRCRF